MLEDYTTAKTKSKEQNIKNLMLFSLFFYGYYCKITCLILFYAFKEQIGKTFFDKLFKLYAAL
jgi:hypothetical protein